LIAAAGLFATDHARAQETGKAVLSVNQRVVTEEDLLQRLELRMLSLEQSGLSPEAIEAERESAQQETLRDLYEEALLLARADELGYEADQTLVDQEVVAIISSPDFRNAIEKESPEDRDRVVARIHKDILKKLTVQEIFRREVQPRVQVSETDVRDFYDKNPEKFRAPSRVRARAVVVLASAERSERDLERIAGEIEAGVRAGRSLEEAAGPYIDVGIVREPVELGWIERGQIEPEIEAKLWATEIGKVIPPFAADGGLHVLQVLQRGDGLTRLFSDVKEELEAKLQFSSFSDHLAEYLYELEQRYGKRGETSVAIPTEGTQTPAEPMTVTPQQPIETAANERRTLAEGAVRSWAAAWSAQDVDGYLSAYSSSFRPESGSRATWAAQRRERVAKPSYIQVDISNLTIDVNGELATATFRQAYASGNYRDEVTKTLELGWENGQWKIRREFSK